MCGIAGIYHQTDAPGVEPKTLHNMASSIRHRGPDEWGAYVDDRIGLVQTRLSIIDLAGGTQPIHNEDQTLWIVYNGEVFNYPELRQDLLAQGHRFYTNTDTEVILHLYEEHGPECLRLLNGQFALAIWNSQSQELFLARDRLGIRPLHYAIHNRQLVFGSEIKAIFAGIDMPRRINPLAIDQVFTFWTTVTPRTFFHDVQEVPPGHYLLASGQHVKLGRYWRIPLHASADRLDSGFEELCERTRALLLDAIRIRLRADVPVGCYLSGGLDSSIVTSAVVNNYNSEVRTFGIRFDESAFDEGLFQNEMVSFLKCNHSESQATNAAIGSHFEGVLWHCEKPLLRTAPTPLYLLSRLVRQSGFKVVLTGEGADEVFGGYNIFREAKVRRFWARFPESQRRAAVIAQLYPYIFKNPRLHRTLQAFFGQGLTNTDDPFYSHRIRWDNASRLKGFFSEPLREQIGVYSAHDELEACLDEDFGRADAMAQSQYLEMVLFLSNYLLSSQGDRVAMANSVEIRLPYLDYRVIDFMAQVPSKWKILGLDEKHLLKRAFAPTLPESVAKRPKHPYRAPISQSLLNSHEDNGVSRMLSEERLDAIGLFDTDKVLRLVKKLRTVEQSSEMDNMALVGILSTQCIVDRFIDHFPSTWRDLGPCDLLVDRRSVATREAR